MSRSRTPLPQDPPWQSSPTPRSPDGAWIASIGVALFFGGQSLYYRHQFPYAVQDDARQHLWWMERWRDPQLFPQDWIADYFQAMAPPGMVAVFQGGASVGIDPLVLGVWLPPLLSLISTLFAFGTVMAIFPDRRAAFLSTLLLNESLWYEDDLVSATPRAFVYPLFLGMTYFLTRKQSLGALVFLGLQGLFYPQIALVSLGVLMLHWWRADRRWIAAALGVVAITFWPYLTAGSQFGPLVSVNEARATWEFWRAHGIIGRGYFFDTNPLVFWLFSPNSGLLFPGILSPLALLAIALPWWFRYPRNWSLLGKFTPEKRLFREVLITSLLLFGLAHVFLFHLYFPNRYMYHSLRMVLCLAGGIAWVVLWDRHRQKFRGRSWFQWPRWSWGWGGVFVLLVALPLYFAPLNQLIIAGDYPQLYTFLQTQPKSIKIASLTEETDNLPVFSQRSILVGRETFYPYHRRYYQEMKRRALALLQAQYSGDPAVVQRFIDQENIQFWVLEQDSFKPDYLDRLDWLQGFTTVLDSLRRQQQQTSPWLAQMFPQCERLPQKIAPLILLDAQCVRSQAIGEAAPSVHRNSG